MTTEVAAHRMPVRVYYEDTDFSGVVYHGNYLRFLERGRTEFLRERGVRQSDLASGDTPLVFAVVHMEIAFRRAACMDDLIEVETDCVALGGASLTIRQRIRRGGEVLTEATVKIAALAGGRATRLPGWLAARLGPTRPVDAQDVAGLR